ncbi:MAG: NAD(P)H-dependent oxidoreductase [Bacteroidia bacterium]
MMKSVLIIHAHPEDKSFCHSLFKSATDYFKSKGFSVETSHLYKMNFNPVGGKHDFKELANHDFFKYQLEQVNAFNHNLFTEELVTEMNKLEKSDIIIFNFPLWWFGLPAILKGWVDRVFAMGKVYGAGKGVYDSGVYKNKIAFACITTGGPEVAYGETGKNGDLSKILFPIHHGMFYFTGMTVLEPFISFSPARQTEDHLKSELERYRVFLDSLEKQKILYSNR